MEKLKPNFYERILLFHPGLLPRLEASSAPFSLSTLFSPKKRVKSVVNMSKPN
jgi:hypothetical protein